MANVNEYSARYSVMSSDFYIPDVDRWQAQSSTNKQGSEGLLPYEKAEWLERDFVQLCHDAYSLYEKSLRAGLSRELARMILPVNFYTEWYWKIDLHNLLHFLGLRAHPHAQYEIQVYAEAIAQIVEDWVPHTYEAYKDYRVDAYTMSGPEMHLLRESVVSMRDDIDYAYLCIEEMRQSLRNTDKLSSREKLAFARAIGLRDD